jgi:ribose 5-phosphate isomerase A
MKDKLNAVRSVINNIRDESLIGLGAGSTVNLLIDEIAKNQIQIEAVTASNKTSYKLEEYGIKEVSIEYGIKQGVQKVFDGADQIILGEEVEILKGHGGALHREKVLWNIANEIFVMVDSSKISNKIDKCIPVEITPFSRTYVMRELNHKFTSYNIRQRYLDNQVPYITENNNYIVELHPIEPITKLTHLHVKLSTILGVVDTGIFSHIRDKSMKIVIGYEDNVEIY